MLFQVFSDAECYDITTTSGFTDEHALRCKNIVHHFFVTHGFIITDLSKYKERTKLFIQTESTEDAKDWHYDNRGCILNFIINVRGEGTSVLTSDGRICTIPVGFGCILVGEEGYKMLGLYPTLHRAPSCGLNRCLIKVNIYAGFTYTFIDPFAYNLEYKITDWLMGSSVCDAQSNITLYKQREANLRHLFDVDLVQVNLLTDSA